MPAPNPLLSVPVSTANEAVLRSFERSLRARKASPRTVQGYLEAARLLAGFLAPDGTDLEDATRTDVERFLIAQLEAHTASSAAVRFRSLQALYKWAVEEEIVTQSPMTGLRAPKPTEKPVPVLGDDVLKALIAACAGKDVYDRRDAAIIRLFLDTGIRLSEMTGITLDDLDMNSDTVTLRGKGDKIRILPFGAKTGQALERYLRVRSRHPLAALPKLWVGKRGVALTPSGITQMLERRAGLAGIGHVHPHQFRHTAAHFVAGKGMGDSDMMRLFGWSSRDMVTRYGSSAADERARAAHRSLAPGDRI